MTRAADAGQIRDLRDQVVAMGKALMEAVARAVETLPPPSVEPARQVIASGTAINDQRRPSRTRPCS